MTIQEFIKQTLDSYDLKHDPEKVLQSIRMRAQALAKNGMAAVDDDTVKDWILQYDPAEKYAEIKAKVTEKKETNVKQTLNKCETNVSHSNSNSNSDSKSKKEEKQNEQLSLFDIL